MENKVFLLGAGPGDPKLMTVKGQEVLKKADVLIYDNLANPIFLNWTKAGCEKIYVGKKAGNHAMKQEDINQLIVDKAKAGHFVVRLKGGDPYVFGRGGEEGELLAENAIDFEVIPGITSAIGGLAYGGIPITHRGIAPSFHVITGHLKDDNYQLDWSTYAKLKGTLVFLMGVKNIDKICKGLMENGKSPHTPVAMIHRASTPFQRTIEGTLETIVAVAEKEKIKAPSLIVVGEVIEKRKVLNFFEKKPLLNKQVIVTRSRKQSSSLLEKITDQGGYGLQMPTIDIVPLHQEKLKGAIENIEAYKYLVLTSINGVDLFFETLFDMGYDSRKLGHLKIAVVGKMTKKALLKYGIVPDLMPESFVGEGLSERLAQTLQKEDRILLPRSKQSRPYLVETLSEIAQVDELHIYDTVEVKEDHKEIFDALREKKVDYVTFTSSSTVKNFVKALKESPAFENHCLLEGLDKEAAFLSLLEGVKIMSIGPMTSKQVTKEGLNVYKEAKEYTIDGLMAVLCQTASGKE